jgi:hypothetical protein
MSIHPTARAWAGTARHAHDPRGGAAEPQGGDARFARHLDADHVPPAQAARAALANRPDLAEGPFGTSCRCSRDIESCRGLRPIRNQLSRRRAMPQYRLGRRS